MNVSITRMVALLLFIAAVLCNGPLSLAADSAPSAKDAPAANSAPTAIPLAEVQSRLAASTEALNGLSDQLANSDVMKAMDADLPRLDRDITARRSEQNKILSQRPSLDVLRALERGWERLQDDLEGKQAAIVAEIDRIERTLEQLQDMQDRWSKTVDATRDTAPNEVLTQMQQHVRDAARVDDRYEAYRKQVLRVQARAGSLASMVSDSLGTIRRQREAMLTQILVRDGPPIWDAQLLSRATQSVTANAGNTLVLQAQTLQYYGASRTSRLALGGIVLVLFSVILWWFGRQLRSRVRVEAGGRSGYPALDMPVASAFILAAFASRWIFPEAPRLLWVSIGLLTLIPTVLLLRRALHGVLMPALYATLVFYAVDQLRALGAALDAVPRMLLILEMTAIAAFLAFYASYIRRGRADPARRGRRRMLYMVTWIACVFCALTAIASALGYVSLSNLLGNALLSGAYYGLFLIALVLVVDALVALALVVRPLSLLSAVKPHEALIRRRIAWAVRLGALVMWLLFFVNRLSIRDLVTAWIQSVLSYDLRLGSLSVSVGDALAFVLTIWAAFLLSRFIRFVLEEEVYPHAKLRRGVPYAISRTVHYLVLLSGFLLGVAALGIDMTKVTILAGAFSVGVGFGLQNIFNNFVSGLILLFERPVQVGDMIQVADTTGIVERIGIRASIVRTPNGAEIIVPNGQLISERLTNWTFSSNTRGIELDVAVAHGPDPRRVIEIINGVAASHPEVSKTPPPQTLLTRMGPDWLGFQLRASISKAQDWMQVRSDLSVLVAETLKTNNIALK